MFRKGFPITIIVEAELTKIEDYCSFIKKHMEKRGFLTKILNFGEELIDDFQGIFIIKGSFLTYEGANINVEASELFGDYFLIYSSSKLSEFPLSKINSKENTIIDIKDKKHPTATFKVLQGIIHELNI